MLLFVNGLIIEEADATEVKVASNTRGTVRGYRTDISTIAEKATGANDIALVALNELLGKLPAAKKTVEVSNDLLSQIKEGINKHTLDGMYTSKKEKEVKQVKEIVGYTKNGIAIVR